MSINPFALIRNAARNAFLSGIADAVNEIAPPDGQEPLTLADLQVRLALPAPEAEKPKKSKAA